MIRFRRPVVLREGQAIAIVTPRGTVTVTAWRPRGLGAVLVDSTLDPAEPGIVTVEAPNLAKERGSRAWRLP